MQITVSKTFLTQLFVNLVTELSASNSTKYYMIFLIDRRVPVFENKRKIKKTKINRKGRNKKK